MSWIRKRLQNSKNRQGQTVEGYTILMVTTKPKMKPILEGTTDSLNETIAQSFEVCSFWRE